MTFTEDQMTPPFPRTVKPARPGVYQSTHENDSSGEVWFSYWNGRRWNGGWYTPRRANHPINRSVREGAHPVQTWRGLNFNPEAQ